jgi:hypothetical protein
VKEKERGVGDNIYARKSIFDALVKQVRYLKTIHSSRRDEHWDQTDWLTIVSINR